MAVTMAGRPGLVKPGVVQWVLVLACLFFWVTKFWLIPRLNINWDEFFFLSNVHAATRGELTQSLQTFYTRLFAWLPGMSGDEIDQIRVARVLMVALLGLSALLVQRLAARWFPPAAAWTAALAFLAMWPTLKHGGSFRADSLLLPLQLAALVVLTHPRHSDRNRGLGAGVLLGLATAISIKAVLLAPVVAVLGTEHLREWRRGLCRLVWLGAAALITAAALLVLHHLSIDGTNAGAFGAAARGAWQTTIDDAPWFPQRATLESLLREDLVFWLVAGAGLAWALWRRLWLVAACALALLPVVFYRNSFSYYYVVMWAPACVTIAAAAAVAHELAARAARPWIAGTAAFMLAALLGAHGVRQLYGLSFPRQLEQRELVAAVHTIFPEPVPYIDHSGMIASFRKVNFFMSTWGVQGYLARGTPFMPRALATFRPPLLIENRTELIPGTPGFALLLAEDREVIESFYQPYWGPIRIAGAAATISGPETVVLHLPFDGRYRLESARAVRIDGVDVEPGSAIDISADRLDLSVTAGVEPHSGMPLTVRLLWASAGPPPPQLPWSRNYYDGL